MTTVSDRVPVRIGNCSGFYGDRIAAAREMVEGGPIDVLCGDYANALRANLASGAEVGASVVVDLDAWTVPDLIGNDDVSFLRHRG